MDDAVQKALENDLVIDITTTGKKTGEPRRKEITPHYVEGQVYITGSPGRRDWYANLVANPEFTFHLKHGTQADLPARATPILDQANRREIFQKIRSRAEARGEITGDLQEVNQVFLNLSVDEWVEKSPLVQVEIMARRL
ncbi:MAG: nitroreductase/quinone reductase family protein [Dehalococcoidia bacterium]